MRIDLVSIRQHLRVPVVAGIAIGIIGAVTFGIAHALIITPIWQSLPGGIPFSVAGGVALAWAFEETRAAGRISLTLRGGILFGTLVWLSLIPMTLFAALLRVFELRPILGEWETAAEVVIAVTSGGLIGRLAGRWRTALAWGVAVFALTLVMGGPVPVTNSAHAAQLFLAFFVIYALAGVALVKTVLWILRIEYWRCNRGKGQETEPGAAPQDLVTLA